VASDTPRSADPGATRSKPADRPVRAAAGRRNPLYAQARMPKPAPRAKGSAVKRGTVQAWPCRSGGICGWQSGGG
jgi:hypothetical protein